MSGLICNDCRLRDAVCSHKKTVLLQTAHNQEQVCVYFRPERAWVRHAVRTANRMRPEQCRTM